MRILFYHAARAWSAQARAMAALARGLSERAHAVTFACAAESAVERHLEFGTYEVLDVRPERGVAATARGLRRALKQRNIQVVVVHTDREQAAAALAARLGARAAVLRRVSAGEPLVLGPRARLALRLAPTGFVYASEHDAARAPALPRARLTPAVVALGVDPHVYDRVRPASRGTLEAAAGARVLVCPYGPEGRERAANVLRVLALLVPRHPDLHLTLVGPGSSDEDLRMHAAALHISSHVSFLGAVEDHLPVLAAADLGWVLAQGDEGAYAFLDLMGSRVPVIAERGTQAERYVPDGIAGLLLPPGGAHDTAAAVARLLAREEQRTAMGSAGHARVAREYTETAMIDAFERAATAASERSRW